MQNDQNFSTACKLKYDKIYQPVHMWFIENQKTYLSDVNWRVIMPWIHTHGCDRETIKILNISIIITEN